MINKTEQEEREYLEVIKEKLLLAIRRVDENVKEFSTELRQSKEYIHEHQSGMDEADMVAIGQSIDRMAFTGESAVSRRRRLMKLLTSPYFGRIDFTSEKSSVTQSIYLGIYTFFDDAERNTVIYDWRAPISSMFYDFELGSAWYTTPNGKVDGSLDLKRQYKIADSQLQFMIENSLSITDEVLQTELSKSADDKMKNIVATIQRDQNAIIRNDTSTGLIIQGVAGSGKTSIALHRIAFLLYKHRDTIKSKDILIISPNKVFADYISNVLPELGEEHIPEMGMEDLAVRLLQNKFTFQTFVEQVDNLLQHHEQKFIERIKFKASFDFLRQLNKYLVHAENTFFTCTELRVAGVVVPGPYIHERFKAYSRMPILQRIPEVTKEIVQFIREKAQRKLSGNEKSIIWQRIPRMVKVSTVFDVYTDFYNWLKQPEMFKQLPGGKLEYADVFPLLYCMIRLEGVNPYNHVKHLLVDEMQDYTPVQYAVLSRVFTCKKTILGDARQTVNPYSASTAETINEIFPLADVVKLTKSYRSTYEIAQFALSISPNPELQIIERHGSEPEIIKCGTNDEEVLCIKNRIILFKNNSGKSMGIICKTHQQASFIFNTLAGPGIHLLTADSSTYNEGVIITTAHLAKGLEFDEVIVPFASNRNYNTDVDRSMLYIACTRAMHSLTLTFTKEKSSFILAEAKLP